MSWDKRVRPLLGADSGFTLIEVLVAIVSALVVMGALMGLLVVSQHQTSVLHDVGQATQSGRDAMTRIVDELHSACIAKEFAPVQKESGSSKLIFINAYSKEAEIKSGERTRKDIITYNKEKGTLTDETIPSSGGEWPNFTFAGTPIKTLIGTNVSETKSEGKSVPVFTYYKYGEAEAAGSTKASSTLAEYEAPLKGFGESEANAIAGVGITFTAAPASGLETVGRSVNLNTQITLAFSAPNTEAEIKDGPCR